MAITVFKPDFTSEQLGYDGELAFGVPVDNALLENSHETFAIPYVEFEFYDARGEPIETANKVYIRTTNSFETTLSNGFQEATGIFGNPMENGSGALSTIMNGISAGAQSFGESLQKQILGGAANLGGFIASAGQTGKQQVEFLTRQMFNTFQQLIYQGPSFRPFNLSFSMRPTNQKEAENMLSIIRRFKFASSPRKGDFNPSSDSGSDESTGESDESETRIAVDASEFSDSADPSAVFTFGYPDMCKIRLKIYVPPGAVEGTEDGDVQLLFESKLCVITNVAVTYGAQNKMVFFKGAKPYPNDVTLNVALREAVLYTAHDVVNETSHYIV